MAPAFASNGLSSANSPWAELGNVDAEVVDVAALKAAGLVRHDVKTIKVIASGKIDKAVKVKGLRVTGGAREQIEAAGGSVEA